MSIFSKFKQNLQHGGITITIEASQSVSRQDESLDITVTLSNQAKVMRTVKKIDAKIQAIENSSDYDMVLNNTLQKGNTTNNNEMYAMQTIIIAEANNTEVFILQPNESKTLVIPVAFNSKFVKNKVEHYKYKIQINAKVEGIDVEPKARKDLQIL